MDTRCGHGKEVNVSATERSRQEKNLRRTGAPDADEEVTMKFELPPDDEERDTKSLRVDVTRWTAG